MEKKIIQPIDEENKGKSTDEKVLRQNAEEILKMKPSNYSHLISDFETLKLIHELEVHQIELKIENEELKQANLEAQISVRKYADLYDFAPSGYFTLSKDGDIIGLNISGSKILGKFRSKLINCKFIDFISDDTKEMFQHFLDKLFRDKFKEIVELTIYKKDSLSIQVLVEGIISENEEHCLLSMVDITARKQAEEVLRKNEQMLENILEHFPGEIFWKDTQSNYLGCNRPFAVAAGLKNKDEIYGKTDYDLPWKESDAENYRIDDRQVIKSGKENLHRIEKKHRLNGDVVWFDTSKIPLQNSNGNVIGVLGVFTDITKRKEAELAIKQSDEQYRMLLELAVDAFFQRDANGNFITVNNSASEITGYSREELLTMNMNDLFSIDTPNEKNLSCDHQKRDIIIKSIREIKRKDEKEIFVEMNSKEMPDGTFQCFMRDITKRKLAEKAMRNAVEKHRELVRNSHDIIYTVTSDGAFTFVSHAWTVLLGHPTNEVLGQRFWKFVHPDDLHLCFEFIHKVIKSGQRQGGIEYRIQHANGSWYWHTSSGVPLRDETGAVIGFEGIASDITDRKKAEKALSESEEKFRGIVEQSLDGIIITDENGNIIIWNKSAENLTGIQNNKAIGHPLWEIQTKLTPNEQRTPELSEKLHAEIKNIIDQKIEWPGETKEEIIKYGGRTSKVIQNSSFIIKIHGVNFFGSIIRDITERKLVAETLRESEEKYRFLFANSPQPMWIFDIETLDFLEVNEAAIGHYGYSREEFLSMTIKDIRPINEVPTLFENLEVHNRYHNPIGEWIHKKKNRDVIIVEINSHPVNYNGRNARHILINDITNRKRAEEELKQSEAALKRQNSLFSSLINNLQIGVFMVEAPSGKPLVANEAAYRFLGRGILPDASKHNLAEVYKAYKKGSLDPYPPQEMPLILGMSGISAHVDDMIIERPDGSKLLLEIFGSPVLDEQGHVWASLVSFYDITERKRAEEELKQLNTALEERVIERTTKLTESNLAFQQAEEKFRTVADFTYGWEYWLNDDGKILYMSPAVEKVTGYNVEEFMNDPDLLNKIIYEADLELWNNHKKSRRKHTPNKRHTELNFRIVKKNGDIRWIGYVCKYVYINGKYMGLRVSNRNITKKIKAANDLLRVTVEVEERERNHFSRELHDGMGPLLSTIKLYFQWLSETEDPEKIKIITERGNANIESAIQTTRDIARGLSTQFVNKFGFVSALDDFIKKINDTEKLFINFTFNCNDRFGLFLETTLYRITTELIKNTITYANATQVEIIFNYSKEQKLIYFTYSDNGVGFNLSKTEKNQNGLGVMNIQQRIKSIMGKIKIKTSTGKGFKVFIQFPIDDNNNRLKMNYRLSNNNRNIDI